MHSHTHTLTNTHPHGASVRAVQGALNEGRTGPFVKSLAVKKQGAESGGMGLGGKCQLKRWEHFLFFSAVSPSGISFTMAHSAAGDAWAYSDEATPDTRWIMKHSTETNQGRQADLRRDTDTRRGACAGTRT